MKERQRHLERSEDKTGCRKILILVFQLIIL